MSQETFTLKVKVLSVGGTESPRVVLKAQGVFGSASFAVSEQEAAALGASLYRWIEATFAGDKLVAWTDGAA